MEKKKWEREKQECLHMVYLTCTFPPTGVCVGTAKIHLPAETANSRLFCITCLFFPPQCSSFILLNINYGGNLLGKKAINYVNLFRIRGLLSYLLSKDFSLFGLLCHAATILRQAWRSLRQCINWVLLALTFKIRTCIGMYLLFRT